MISIYPSCERKSRESIASSHVDDETNCHGRRQDVDRGPGSITRLLYTNDRETKAFLEREARKLDPAFKRRSGARYRLNRWRDAQLTGGAPITYRDLVKEYVRLNHPETTHRRAPVDRYVYFLSDFMAANPGATMAVAIRAWKKVKTMDSPKNYRAFARTD